MDKYINGGIIKSFTVIIKNDEDILDILSVLGDKVDLSLFEMKKLDNLLYFDIKEDIILNNFIELFYELRVKDLYLFDTIDSNIKTLEKNINKGLDTAIKMCDDIFIERTTIDDVTTLNNDLYDIEVEFYTFFFDGPHENGNYKLLIDYILKLQKNSLDNILNGAVVFSIK